MKTKTIINGYKIQYNEFWEKYQVSHDEIGTCIAKFNSMDEAIDYCERG